MKINKKLGWVKVKTEAFIDFLNKDSKLKHKSMKIHSIRSTFSLVATITVFCYSLTTSYYGEFGVNYFLHFHYLDIYTFTLGHLDLYFDLVLLTLLLVVVSCGAFISLGKSSKEEYFSKGQVYVLRLIPISLFLIIILFVMDNPSYFHKALDATVLCSFSLGLIYLNYKAKHDIFLICFLVFVSIGGYQLGTFFAGKRFASKDYIRLTFKDRNRKFKTSQIVIGQNESMFIVVDKKDSLVDFIPKSEIAKTSFKANILRKLE